MSKEERQNYLRSLKVGDKTKSFDGVEVTILEILKNGNWYQLKCEDKNGRKWHSDEFENKE